MKTLEQAWSNWTVDLACDTRDCFWSGARKIFQNKQFVTKLDSSLSIENIGYTKYKLTRLHDQYFVKDSFDVAMMLHERNIKRRKYASSAFHCYGHLLKATDQNRSKRGSVMGPCLQSVVVTLRPHERRTSVDVFYRTTEAFKKLPADFIWLRDYVLPHIPGQDQYPVVDVRFHFVNVTIHPMYIATILPLVPDAIATLELIRDRDRAMWAWSGKWMARYLIGGAAARSIEKFSQAQRTAMAAVTLLEGPIGDAVVRYLCDNRKDFMPSRTNFEGLNEAFDAALERVT
jgi:hypothetical protein